MPEVSIIMPAYNCQDYIGESIGSVIAQSFVDWELIVVDDCSTDETGSKIKQFLFDGRIILIESAKNEGGAVSRNKAIQKARGRYIAFLDADDKWKRDKLEQQISFMKNRSVGFSFSGYEVIYDHNNRVDVIEVPERVCFSDLLKHNYIGCLTAIYDSYPFGKIYMPLVRKRQDFALWLELLKKFDYAYSLPMNLGSYRVRPGTLSSSKKDAFVYYWRVLRDVGGCGFAYASYNILLYMVIVLIKKRFPFFYNNYFLRYFK